MSKLYYRIPFGEEQYSKNDEFIQDWKTNPPHADDIGNFLSDEWNNSHIEKSFD